MMSRTIPAASRFSLLLTAAISIAASPLAIAPAQGQDAAKVEAGSNIYREYCQNCHGDDLVNTGQTFDLRRLKPDERPRFENSVLNGKNQMPPWKGVIEKDQLELLWAYIRANAYQK